MNCESCPFIAHCDKGKAKAMQNKASLEGEFDILTGKTAGTPESVDSFYDIVNDTEFDELRRGPRNIIRAWRWRKLQKNLKANKQDLENEIESAQRIADTNDRKMQKAQDACHTGPKIIKKGVFFGRKREVCGSPGISAVYYFDVPKNNPR